MRMSRVKKILAIIENLLFLLFCIIVILFLIQLFCFTSFKIPSDSMEPALKDGDRILVNKMIKGPDYLTCSLLWITKTLLFSGYRG